MVLLSAEQPKLSIREVIALLDTTTSQIYHILYKLEKMQYLQKGKDRKCQLGRAVMHQELYYLSTDEITEVAIKPMQTLCDNTGANCLFVLFLGEN